MDENPLNSTNSTRSQDLHHPGSFVTERVDSSDNVAPKRFYSEDAKSVCYYHDGSVKNLRGGSSSPGVRHKYSLLERVSIHISETSLNEDKVGKHVVYKIIVTHIQGEDATSSFETMRRYSDFLTLMKTWNSSDL